MFDKYIKVMYHILLKDGDFMVIRNDFDRTLWLMLISDRKNRNDIGEFIKNVPKDLLERIHLELDKCPIDDEKYPLKKINKAFRNNNGDTYFYTVSLNGCQIIINLSIWNQFDSTYDEVIQITLYSLSMDDIKDIEPEYPIYIGDYYHIISKMSYIFDTVICKGNDRGYELVDSDDYSVTIQSVDGKIDKNIDISRMPVEINVDDFIDKKSINRLVRKRSK